MKIKKKTFAAIIFSVAFVMMVGISVLSLWTNDVLPIHNNIPAIGDESTDSYLYPACDEQGLWGYVDSANNYVVEPKYDKAELFLGDIAWVQENNLWGAINKKGQVVVECNYPEKKVLDDDLYKICMVSNDKTENLFNSKGEKIFGTDKSNGKTGHMDGGLISFCRIVDGVENWGYIDVTGQVVIAPLYKSVGDAGLTHAIAQTFDDETVLVKRSDGTETVLPGGVDLYGIGSNSLLFAENGKYGYLDMSGNVSVAAQFDEAYAFSNGLALVKNQQGYGLIDETGQFVVPAKYKYAENIGNGYYMFGESATSDKTIYDKKGEIVLENVCCANKWFDGYLNVETEKETKIINAYAGLMNNVSMSNNNLAVFYGNRFCAKITDGYVYYDLNGNLLESYGQSRDVGNDCRISSCLEFPDACLEIVYPEVTIGNSELQGAFKEISQSLKDNALSDFEKLYKESDGTVDFMVKGSFEYDVCGSVVTILQKTKFIEDGTEEEYQTVVFDMTTGEMYNISSMFLDDINWRADLGDTLTQMYVDQYSEQKPEITDALSQKLSRQTGFLLRKDGLEIFVPYEDEHIDIFVSYEDIRPFVNEESAIWKNMQIAKE